MLKLLSTAATLFPLAFLLASPAAADGEVLLTHAKALAGNVTPGDAPGYPITISQYGVYQFAGAIHPTAGSIGIQVTGSDVTIDLNGFRMHGSTTAWHGITGGVDNVTIRNGTITGFKFDGINGSGDKWVVEDMRVVDNGRYGIYPLGYSARVVNNTASENGLIGIRCHHHCLVEGNVVTENGSTGVAISSGMVLGNTIASNVGLGISAGAVTGIGNNTISSNNGGFNPQVSNDAQPMHPNRCLPACP
jgi:hypothetical protein